MTQPKESPEALALRAPPRPVTRLNRRTLIAVVGVVSGVLLGVTLWSLRDTRGSADAPTELHNTDRIQPAEGLAQLPGDYSKVNRTPVPALGPPLPGDLGEAMFRAEKATTAPGERAPAATMRADSAADAARAERIARQREIEDAAKATLFFKTAQPTVTQHTTPERESKSKKLVDGTSATSLPTMNPETAERDSVRSADLPGSTQSRAPELGRPASPYTLLAGTVIPAALITGVNSDLPGPAIASVTEAVYDSVTGRHLLVPQSSRLLGQYDSHVAYGQKRVLLIWTRLTLPDGSSIALDRLPAVDVSGYAGLQDEVDSHWRELIAGAAMSTLLGVGAELAAPDRSVGNNQVIVATRQGLQDSVNQVGQELTRRSLAVQPTITIREGFPLRVIVSRDLVLRPYQPLLYEVSARRRLSTPTDASH